MTFIANKFIEKYVFLVLLFIGGVLYGVANSTVDVFFVILIYFCIGLLICMLSFQNKKSEIKAYFFTFSVCVFFGGLAQSYSLLFFDNLQSTFDAANFFFPSIDLAPPFQEIEQQLYSMEYALPIVIWQQLYIFFWNVGLDAGPYIGVLINSLVMGVTAATTVSIARLVYGNDEIRLNKTAVLFSLCGIFILFGSVLIRDCFTTLLNVVVLWGLIRWLKEPKIKNFIILFLVLIISSSFMFFLRVEAIALFGVYCLLALFFWFTKRGLTLLRLFILVAVLIGVVILSGTLLDYINLMMEIQNAGLTQYEGFSANESSNNSLGMKIVINQPIPIRLITGTAVMLLYPLPLWVHFNFQANDYNWLLGLYGLFKVVLLPSVLVCVYVVYKNYFKDKKNYVLLAYISLYLIVNVAAIVLTSLEQRHLGQFMAAFIILAVFPDKYLKKRLSFVSKFWYGSVIFIHIAWVLIKVF